MRYHTLNILQWLVDKAEDVRAACNIDDRFLERNIRQPSAGPCIKTTKQTSRNDVQYTQLLPSGCAFTLSNARLNLCTVSVLLPSIQQGGPHPSTVGMPLQFSNVNVYFRRSVRRAHVRATHPFVIVPGNEVEPVRPVCSRGRDGGRHQAQ